MNKNKEGYFEIPIDEETTRIRQQISAVGAKISKKFVESFYLSSVSLIKPTDLTEELKKDIRSILYITGIVTFDSFDNDINNFYYPPIHNIRAFYTVLRLCLSFGIDLELLIDFLSTHIMVDLHRLYEQLTNDPHISSYSDDIYDDILKILKLKMNQGITE